MIKSRRELMTPIWFFILFLFSFAFLISADSANGQDGSVAIFLDCYSGGSTDVIEGIVIETDRKANVVILPETGQGKVIYQYESPDYAPNTQTAYTVNRRLFFCTSWSSGRLDVEEKNPHTFEKIGEYMIGGTTGVSLSKFAVVGNKAYYNTKHEWNYLYGYRGGEFKVYNFTNKTYETLLAYGHEDNKGDHFSGNDNLYSILTTDMDENTVAIIVYKRDLSSGEIADVKGVSYTHNQLYQLAGVAIDGDALYWVAKRYSDGNVSIWRYFYGGGVPEKIFSEIIMTELTNINKIDVDNGYIFLALRTNSETNNNYNGNIFWYDSANNEWTVLDTGLNIFSGQIFYYDTLPDLNGTDTDDNSGSDSSTDTNNETDAGNYETEGSGSNGGLGCFINILGY